MSYPSFEALFADTSLSLPILRIDLRTGNVEMRHGADVWRGQVSINSANLPNINEALTWAVLEGPTKRPSEPSQGSEG
jgi:hypothetical protein